MLQRASTPRTAGALAVGAPPPRPEPAPRPGRVRQVWAAIRDYLPRGQTLTDDVWRVRHRTLGWLLRFHVAAIFVYALVAGRSFIVALGFAAIVAIFAVLASTAWQHRRFASAATAVGLVVSSAVLVELSGGLIEMHFHFFVMVSLLTLYQDWMPFLIAVGFVLVDHGLFGVIAPRAVYNHQSAVRHPLEWALVHAAFLLAACIASVVAWKMNEEQAFKDALTKLPNRALFQDRLEHALARVERRPGALAVMFIDLDGFKDVNDSLGHAAGDQLLRGVADRFRACVRPGDTVARLGGDEFAVLLEDRGASHVDGTADRILCSLELPLMLGGREQRVGASIGIATSAGGDHGDDLMRNADVAMYVAKTRGKGAACHYVPGMHAAVVERLELEREIAFAAVNGELALCYQPFVSLTTGLWAGVEALVRWKHPTRGTLYPEDFIWVAEDTGAIVELGAWVLNEACQQARAWADQYGQLVTVAVNVSPVQLADEGIVDLVSNALAAAQLDPSLLVLEITERVMLIDSRLIAARLDQLKAVGVGMAVDDFGTGYASLEYLRRLPVDTLKVDKSFVDRMADGPRDLALVGAIIHLADTLGMTTVAEGVETAAQVAALADLGCHLAQGFAFTPPMPAGDISALLAAAPQ